MDLQKTKINRNGVDMKNGQNALTANGAVLRQAGCNSADSFVGIWNCVARINISEPPPKRKAASTLWAMAGQRRDKKKV
jgi:hypothetical protein